MSDYAGRTVLVTGADGFIGSHLVERLVHAGARVRALCLYNSQGSWGWLDEAPAAIKDAVEVRLGDVRDGRFVEAVAEGVEVLFHLAALISIPYSYTAPQSFVDTNVTGTMNVLEAAKRNRVARIVHTSTSEVYGTPETLPITEAHPLKAQSPYAATKVAADQLAMAYHATYGSPVVVLRPFNTYGPRQSMRAVLPTILGQLLQGRTEVAVGRLDTRRDLTFIDDTVAGFMAAGHAASVEGRTIHLGTGRSISIGDLFALACRTLGVQANARTEDRRLRPDASEVLVLESDHRRATAELGWQPRVTLEQGVRATADWLREHMGLYHASFHA